MTKDGKTRTQATEKLPELRPSQVGWIFRDGGCVAIERQDDDTADGMSDR